MTATSWGGYPKASALAELDWDDRHAALPAAAGKGMLPHGMGRSYGDVALNEGGLLLHTRRLDRFMAFDEETGVLRVEAGVTLAAILELFVPRGWFLPVTPGTQFVTMGGAVANDVHGKNHHVAGSFGHHVRALELLRSDGRRIFCATGSNEELLRATIGGLGLTGLITWVDILLQRIPGPVIAAQNRRFASVEGYWDADAELRHSPYTVAWIDCLGAGRGIYSAGDFTSDAAISAAPAQPKSLPITPPVSMVNFASVKLFNALYYRKPLPESDRVHFSRFFYPLDSVAHWNRIYGRKGFVQYQCVLPPSSMKQALKDLLALSRRYARGSFLAVLKSFGDRPPAGLLSFPRPGATLAVDFPFEGEFTLKLLTEFDAVTRAAGGALYPAKDARMPPEMFRMSFPQLDQFRSLIDPCFSSSFWRRVGMECAR